MFRERLLCKGFVFGFKGKKYNTTNIKSVKRKKKDEFYEHLNHPEVDKVCDLENFKFSNFTEKEFKETPVSKDSIELFLMKSGCYYTCLKENVCREFKVYYYRRLELEGSEPVYVVGYTKPNIETSTTTTFVDFFLPRRLKGDSKVSVQTTIEVQLYNICFGREDIHTPIVGSKILKK